ncbi:MAG: DUF423 domain-containing protein [Verrucomicrobia bacterium]|nr:DUF423 domain-containing protein [Verrucomicrobiota bacterium]
MKPALAEKLAALCGLLAVGLGAFGAHGLSRTLAQFQTAEIWDKAVFYHGIHAVVLFILAGRAPFRFGPWLCFLFGILLFSGSLYLLAATNARWLGAVTPIGGTSFLIGWFWLMLRPVDDKARKAQP